MEEHTTRSFILRHRLDDVRKLALQAARYPDVDFRFALQQIDGWQRARIKLPTWAECNGIIYPPHLAIEQCSSEVTARYKKELVERLMGDTPQPRKLVDLTGGMGVDFSFLARLFTEATYVERERELCEVAENNFRLLGLGQAKVICGDSTRYLDVLPHVQLIYLDPARRNIHGGRTFAISDCTPDAVALAKTLTEKADAVLLKLSPMLDWHKAVDDLTVAIGLPHVVSEVHIVSVNNECKELLLLLQLRNQNPLRVFCANDQQVFVFSPHKTSPSPPPPLAIEEIRYVYEPNASVMKAGCFEEFAVKYGVSYIGENSHLLVSSHILSQFHGRSFVVDAVVPMSKKNLRAHLAHLSKANIAVRNYPASVASLRKRLKLSEGGDAYIFATTRGHNEHVLLLCRRVTTH